MASDIKLDGESVIIEGRWTELRTWDLKLDGPGRRGSKNKQRPRRALVHDTNDGLTINYDGDYPGGVKIKGEQILLEGKWCTLRVNRQDLSDKSGRKIRETFAMN